MKSRIEQDHEQHPDFALILLRGAAYAPLPQATKAGAKVHSHPLGCIRPRRAHSHGAPKGAPEARCRSAPDRGLRPPLPRRGRPRVTRVAPVRLTNPREAPLAHQTALRGLRPTPNRLEHL